MTLRDEHAAALARIHALENELGLARTVGDRGDEIVELERRLHHERTKLERAEVEVAKVGAKLRPPATNLKVVFGGIVIVVALIVIIALVERGG